MKFVQMNPWPWLPVLYSIATSRLVIVLAGAALDTTKYLNLLAILGRAADLFSHMYKKKKEKKAPKRICLRRSPNYHILVPPGLYYPLRVLWYEHRFVNKYLLFLLTACSSTIFLVTTTREIPRLSLHSTFQHVVREELLVQAYRSGAHNPGKMDNKRGIKERYGERPVVR